MIAAIRQYKQIRAGMRGNASCWLNCGFAVAVPAPLKAMMATAQPPPLVHDADEEEDGWHCAESLVSVCLPEH